MIFVFNACAYQKYTSGMKERLSAMNMKSTQKSAFYAAKNGSYDSLQAFHSRDEIKVGVIMTTTKFCLYVSKDYSNNCSFGVTYPKPVRRYADCHSLGTSVQR